jgi:uncharacterized Zn ribbon protein
MHYTIATIDNLHWNKSGSLYDSNASKYDYFDGEWRYAGHDCDGVGLEIRDSQGFATELKEGDTVTILKDEE